MPSARIRLLTATGLIAEMNKTVEELNKSDHEAMRAIGEELAPAVDALEHVTKWIVETFKEDPIAAASGATPYMRMMGFITGGWLMAVTWIVTVAMLESFAPSKAV